MNRYDYTVSQSCSGLRADVFLRQVMPDLPESILRKLFERRDVRVEHTRIARNTLLKAGDRLSVFLPESSVSQPLEIVYEDADVLLVNKRSGISVEQDSGGGLCLTDLCRQHMHGGNAVSAAFPAPCHRLDNQTCGLCLFAKNERALLILGDVFRRRTLDKRYECLVRGIPKPPEAVCSAYLLKDSKAARVTIYDHAVPGARSITTEYATLEAGPVSRLQVHLITGRTHQIRAHLAALGHPLLGDDLYGDRIFNREHKARTLRLCAVSLTLDTEGRLPDLDGRTVRIQAPF